MTIDDCCNHFYAQIRRKALFLSPEKGEDLVQETFCKAMRAWTPIQEGWTEAQLAGWLYRILHRTTIDAHRAAMRQMTVPLLAEGHDQLIGSSIEAIEDRLCFEQAWAQIPPKGQEALLLKLDGWKFREIGGFLHLTESGAKTRTDRARRLFVEAYSA